MTDKRLSICIATYNRAAILRETLAHVTQLGLDAEIIVSDNASTDDTRNVVASFGGVVYFRQRGNRGPMENFATAIAMATGRYVYTLSDDDRLLPDGIAAAMSVLDQHTDVTAVYGGYEEWDPAANKVLATDRPVEQATRFEPAQKVDVLNRFVLLWFPVARREVLQRHCGYDDRTWGEMRLAGQLLSRGPIVVIPDLFYRHAHTAERLENALTESWYHDHFRSDYELFLAEAVSHPDPVQVGHFIGQRAAPAYYHAVRFARKKRQYLVARHFVLRAKAYNLFTDDALVKWERDNLDLVLADKVRHLASRLPEAKGIVFERCDAAGRCIAALREQFPDAPPADMVDRAAWLSRESRDGELLLAEQYDTVAQRARLDPLRCYALADLIEQCRVTANR